MASKLTVLVTMLEIIKVDLCTLVLVAVVVGSRSWSFRVGDPVQEASPVVAFRNPTFKSEERSIARSIWTPDSILTPSNRFLAYLGGLKFIYIFI